MKYLIVLILWVVADSEILGDCPYIETGIHDKCGVCSSRNDPHINTFDSIYYDQHSEACYKYVTDCPETDIKLPFEVCGCHYPCSGGKGGCPSNIMCIGDVSITFYEGNSVSRIVNIDYLNPVVATWDEWNVTPPVPIPNINHVSGASYIFDTVEGDYYLYIYDSATNTHYFEIHSGVGSSDTFYGYIKYRPGNLEIHLNEGFFSTNTCGLCGYFDVDNTNEFLGSDNVDYIDPALVSPGIITPTDVAKINNFANTYLCDGETEPNDPICQPSPNADRCAVTATKCCHLLWQQTLEKQEWLNPIINVDEFKKTWLIGCARDVCGLTKDRVDLRCDLKGNEFGFSKDILIDTAAENYVLSIAEPRCKCLEYFDGCNWCTCDPKTGLSVCTKKHCNPWGEYECFDNNCTAKICAHGDNRIKLDVSYDSGTNWDLGVATESDWRETIQINISPIDANTILRFTVADAGVIGGFLCTIQLCGNNGYIFEFYTDTVNTYFDVISESPNNDQLLDVFHKFGTGPWANDVNPDKVECMNINADWMWNNHKKNTMVFEVNFFHHLDILEKLDCIPSTTPEPTDCCNHFNGVSHYLDECGYCPPTPAPTHDCCHYYDGCNWCHCNMGPNGETMCTLKFCQHYGEFKCLDGRGIGTITDKFTPFSKANTVEVNKINNNNNDGFGYKLNKEMNEIKYLIYGTWIIIFISFSVILLIKGTCRFNNLKKQTFKPINHNDTDQDI